MQLPDNTAFSATGPVLPLTVLRQPSMVAAYVCLPAAVLYYSQFSVVDYYPPVLPCQRGSC